MIISDKYEFLFLEPAKNGTTSMNVFFDFYLEQVKDNTVTKGDLSLVPTNHPNPTIYWRHAGLKEIIKAYPKTKNYFKFVFVRNTWDRVLSHYLWLKKHSFHTKKHKLSGTTLEDWVTRKNPDNTYKKTIRSQMEYVKYDGVNVDFIGQFSKLNEDFCKLLEIVKLTKSRDSDFCRDNFNTVFPHENKTERTEYRKYYNEKTKNIIEDLYQEEINFFNFCF